MPESVSLSRATTPLSRTGSRHGSSVSRAQSLIKKNTAVHDLRPSDILIERFIAWKAIVKQLIAYFEGIADIENNVAREMTKLGAVIQVPFRAGNQFLGEGGLQDIFYGIRDKTRAIADEHANFGRTVEGSIVQHLQKLRIEIKAHIRNIQNDTGKLATSVAKEREYSAKLIGDLSTHISILKNTPLNVTAKMDPFVANQIVARQLVKQVFTENALQKSLLLTQASSAVFEASLIQALQSAWATYSEWRERMHESMHSTWGVIGHDMADLAPDKEWIAFAAREDHLVDPETPLRDPLHIQYPSKEDPSVIPVHTGNLERKKRYTRTYREAFYVLTPAGFLHEFASSDPAVADKPLFSLFLPMCTLGPPAGSSAKSHKFHIEGRKDGTGTTHSGSFRNLAQTLTGKVGKTAGSGHAWAFRARSHDDMMEWWNDIRMLCARYLVASEQMERSGPVEAAVRSAGYLSEDEDEENGTDEDEGSSVEEEDDDMYEQARDDDEHHELPEYSHRGREEGIAEHGYPVDKKPHAVSPGHGNGANISRRHSKRQQEKAPEGRTPHVLADDETGQAAPADTEPGIETEPEATGPAPTSTESKFLERL